MQASFGTLWKTAAVIEAVLRVVSHLLEVGNRLLSSLIVLLRELKG